MTVGVMITSRNRADDLAATLEALGRLAPAPAEVLVTLDGCIDGSAGMLKTRFPCVRPLINSTSQGSIPSRDRMLRTAASDLVLSLDDDSYPVESDFLARAAPFFANPSLAILTFPQRSEEFPASLHQTDFGPDQFVGSFPSSGALLRRETYLQTRGYATLFGHAYEEPDYSLQCIAHGQQVRKHTGLTIRHHYSSKNRNELRVHQLHARNELWSVLMRCPSPWWPAMVLRKTGGQCAYAARRGASWLVHEPMWWRAALAGAAHAWRQRAPVSWGAYRRWLKLLRQPEPCS